MCVGIPTHLKYNDHFVLIPILRFWVAASEMKDMYIEVRYFNDICQIQIQIQNIPPCIWKYTHMCGFSHTCVVFTKHFDRSQVFGRNHTCVVFTTHMEVHVISGNSHTCVVFPKQPERSLKTHGHIYFKHMEVFFSTKTLFLHNFCFWYRNMQLFF